MHSHHLSVAALVISYLSISYASTIPHDEPFRLPLNDYEDNHSSTVYPTRKSSTKGWTTTVRDKFVEKWFGRSSGERHHGQQKHPHLSSQIPLNSDSSSSSSSPPFSRYQNDVVLRFNVSTHEEAQALAEAAEILFLDVWSATKDHADIRVDRDVVESLLGLLPDSLQSSHARLMHDLAATVRETFPGSSDQNSHFSSSSSSFPSSSRSNAKAEHFFSNYQPLSVINPWMKLMQSLFATHVETFTIGKSYEGRTINGIKVHKRDTPSDTKRKAIVITGASHAREWISVSTVSYLAHSFITGYRPKEARSVETENAGDKAIIDLVDNFDWYFIPTLNVDGYVYTWEEDRLWRKNRQPTSLGFCKGIELDRSYGFKWGGQSQQNPCSENYPGEYEFEALEAKHFADWAKNITTEGHSEIVAFLDLHSYSQQILYPFSYTCSERPADLENLEELAEGLAKAIRIRHGEHYEVSSACEGGAGRYSFPSSTKDSSFPSKMSKKSNKSKSKSSKSQPQLTETGGGGAAIDYFYSEIKVPYSYQIKLRDQGSYGFLLPKDAIRPTGEEIESMVKSLGKFLIGDN